MVRPDKLLLLIAGLLLLLAPSRAGARGWELVTGRVQEILRHGEQVTLILEPDAAAAESPEPVSLEVPAGSCPEKLQPGSRVRIWSKTKGSGTTVYKISASRGCDPTGVRLRLRRHGHRFGGRRGGKGGGHGGH